MSGHILKRVVLSCTLSFLVQGVTAAPAAAEQTPTLENYQRRYISFYQAQQGELDAFLVRFFQRELPRFDYRAHRKTPSL